MSSRQAATIISASHLPQARVLAESLAEHHPEVRLSVVLVDAPPSAATSESGSAGDTLSPLELGIGERELHRRALLYPPLALAISLRPLVISHLLRGAAESVLLLDADMLVLERLDDLWALAEEHGLLLTPHTLVAREDPAGVEGDELYLRAGTFNDGFLGVGPGGQRFLRWLAARVRRECVFEPVRGLHYAQTWFNLVPGLFDHLVLRDAGVNVTAHRLRRDDLELEDGQLTVNGDRLRLLHLTGFDPLEPLRLCRHLAGPDGGLEHRPRLRALCDRYRARLQHNGWPSEAGYGWGKLPCGLVVDDGMRAAYRDGLLASERGLCEEPPDPFDTGSPDRFPAWLDRSPAQAPA